MARRCAPYFAYLTADSKQIEPLETVHLIFRYSDLFEIRISESRAVAVLVSSTGIK